MSGAGGVRDPRMDRRVPRAPARGDASVPAGADAACPRRRAARRDDLVTRRRACSDTPVATTSAEGRHRHERTRRVRAHPRVAVQSDARRRPLGCDLRLDRRGLPDGGQRAGRRRRLCQDRRDVVCDFCYRGQRRQDWEREYFRDYYPVDERFPRLRQLAEGRIVHATDLFSEQELQTSPVYNEGMAKAHCQNSVYVRLTGSDHSQIFWMIADPVDASDWSSDQLTLMHASAAAPAPVRAGPSRAGRGWCAPHLAHELLDTRGAGVIQLDRHGRMAAGERPGP